MSELLPQTRDYLLRFIDLSRDGYAIFSADDALIFCNEAFAEVFGLKPESAWHKTFADLLRHSFQVKTGIRIDSGDVELFISESNQKRRSKPYRLFEVDLVDGRWLLFSEHTDHEGNLLVQTKDMTKQKVVEQSLKNSVAVLHHLALTDELTRVANRRSFVESVESELSRCRRSGAAMTMALLDLDFFKKVNDTYGHQGGDAALMHVASIIREGLRQYDILGRIGGEEFAIFLSNTSQEIAYEVAERTRRLIESSPLEYGEETIHLTVSIGLTTHGCNATFEELYLAADAALYEAKNKGRNCIVIAG